MLFLVLLAIVAYLLYVKYVKPLQYWREKGIPFATPVPIFGNMFGNFIGINAYYEIVAGIYKRNADKR